MHENDIYFLRCLSAEQEKRATEIEWSAREPWPSGHLVKLIKRLLAEKPDLNDALSGSAGVIESLKAAARGNVHAERVRNLVVRELINTDTFQAASRRVLKNWLAEWANQDPRWQSAPIRFYPSAAPLAPCIQGDGQMVVLKDTRPGDLKFTFDATWLWGNYCVYAWHRWVESTAELDYLPEIVRLCGKATTSVYQDKVPCFLFIVHGPGVTAENTAVDAPPNTKVIPPWEIVPALESVHK